MRMRHYPGPFDISSRERARYRLLVDAARSLPEIAWVAHSDGSLEYYNRHWFRYTGQSLAQTRGAGWVSVVHPQDLRASVEKWTQALTSGEPVSHDYRLMRADGVYVWHHGYGVPICDAHGGIIKWFGITVGLADKDRVAAAILACDLVTAQVQRRILELENGGQPNRNRDRGALESFEPPQ